MPGEAHPPLKSVRLLYAAFNNYDVGGVIAMMHPEVELILADERGEPHEGGRRSGREAVRGYCEEMRAAMRAPMIRAKEFHESGDSVVAEVVIHGISHDSGDAVTIPAVQLFAFEDGLVRSFRTHRTALGAPTPAERALLADS